MVYTLTVVVYDVDRLREVLSVVAGVGGTVPLPNGTFDGVVVLSTFEAAESELEVEEVSDTIVNPYPGGTVSGPVIVT